MAPRTYRIVREPRGELWSKLLLHLGRYATYISVIIRDGLPLEKSGQDLLRRLSPYVVDTRRVTSWPGTVLLGEEASLTRIKASADAICLISETVQGLYDWRQPRFPEDLALLAEDGGAVLGSVAHESDAFLELNDDQYAETIAAIPDISHILARQDVGRNTYP